MFDNVTCSDLGTQTVLHVHSCWDFTSKLKLAGRWLAYILCSTDASLQFLFCVVMVMGQGKHIELSNLLHLQEKIRRQWPS